MPNYDKTYNFLIFFTSLTLTNYYLEIIKLLFFNQCDCLLFCLNGGFSLFSHAMTHCKKVLSIFFLVLFLFSFTVQHFSQLIEDNIVSFAMETEKELGQDTIDYEYLFSFQGLTMKWQDPKGQQSPQDQTDQISEGFLNNTSPPPEA